ncbi:hypothetical protein OGATHE_002137 [Ogataea polymorpha]|uniref:Uncharacterized protein n=1 Tax=Ogataea polymorpha TaxID=460523 RepID=A0A9P8PMF7_9ASCO|nr:hypothetical protein OGATHE_002137 [Ogataea polymorpha]
MLPLRNRVSGFTIARVASGSGYPNAPTLMYLEDSPLSMRVEIGGGLSLTTLTVFEVSDALSIKSSDNLLFSSFSSSSSPATSVNRCGIQSRVFPVNTVNNTEKIKPIESRASKVLKSTFLELEYLISDLTNSCASMVGELAKIDNNELI